MEQAVFESAITFTLQQEGGGKMSMDEADPGNWTGGVVGVGELKGTKYGISAAAFPWVDIQRLNLPAAIELYREHYWKPCGAWRIAAAAPDLACRLFDLAVNCGVGTATRMLQRAVNVVCTGEIAPQRRANWRQKIATILGKGTLRVDGIIGAITASVIGVCPYKPALLIALKGEAYNHYRTGKPLYIPGWLQRLGS
jgi:lysozyme family protein